MSSMTRPLITIKNEYILPKPDPDDHDEDLCFVEREEKQREMEVRSVFILTESVVAIDAKDKTNPKCDYCGKLDQEVKDVFHRFNNSKPPGSPLVDTEGARGHKNLVHEIRMLNERFQFLDNAIKKLDDKEALNIENLRNMDIDKLNYFAVSRGRRSIIDTVAAELDLNTRMARMEKLQRQGVKAVGALCLAVAFLIVLSLWMVFGQGGPLIIER